MTADEIRKLLINSDASIKHAIKTIDDAAKGIALAVDEDLRLRGTITDGDVRRAILKGISLDSPVKSIMNENFTFVTKNCSRLLVENIFQQKSILQIPVLDDHMRVVDVIFYSDFFKKPCKENQAVIMAGGLGTRLSPLTREIPKPMLQVGAKPILETIIDQLKSYGYKNIIICLNYKAGVIKNYFRDGSDFGVFIKYINEEKRLGTAGAIRLAKKYLDKPFFVINGDILTKLNFEQFMQFHIKMNNAITIGTKKYEMEIPYGVVDIKDESVISICEKPTLDFFVSGGLYCLNPETLEHIPENEYFDITQLISSYIQANNKVGSFPITEYWMDIGQMEDYRRANMDYESKFRSDRCAVVK